MDRLPVLRGAAPVPDLNLLYGPHGGQRTYSHWIHAVSSLSCRRRHRRRVRSTRHVTLATGPALNAAETGRDPVLSTGISHSASSMAYEGLAASSAVAQCARADGEETCEVFSLETDYRHPGDARPRGGAEPRAGPAADSARRIDQCRDVGCSCTGQRARLGVDSTERLDGTIARTIDSLLGRVRAAC